MRRLGWVGVVVLVGCLAGSVAAWAQAAKTVVSVPVPLLPESFGDWKSITTSDDPKSELSLVNVNKDALEECGPKRSQTANYQSNVHGSAKVIRVEAVEFNDATGAYSAFTLSMHPGMKLDKGLGSAAAIGDGAVLFQTGSSLALVYPATAADVSGLGKLADAMPKIGGSKAQPALLPTFFPVKGLVRESLRYATGPVSYTAMGGTLAPAQLGWEKSAEAAMAEYADKRGKELLTLLLYPTPQIAGNHAHAIATQLGSGAKVRREGELVIVATGSFSGDDAQNFVENIHLHTEVSFDKPMPLEFHAEVQKTYSLLVSISILSGFGCLAAVLLGLFFGGGRAIIRKMQGKDAATDAEFLSLHLANQNDPPKFDPPAS